MFLLWACMCDPGGTETGDETGDVVAWDCVIEEDEPDFSQQIGCWDDFDKLASAPLDASIPGARSAKTVIDRTDDDALYFQNSEKYQIHWEFASEHLSGDGLPLVGDMASFNASEYFSPDRRFLLGALTFYEEPQAWTYEISPYDTATADMVASAFYNIRDNGYFGDELYFHPTSTSIDSMVAELPDDIPIITTDEIYANTTYQPLNLGETMAQLVFTTVDEIEEEPPSYRELVVLDAVPLDIGVVAGIITAEFQTPLAHINVLSQNRGTPNMALRDAFEHEDLVPLEGKWVHLVVESTQWSITEVTQEEAEAWWEENKPDPIVVTPFDTSITALTDDEDVLDLESMGLEEALDAAVPVFGGKGSHFGALSEIGDDVPHPDAFMIPAYWYDQHMQTHGLWDVAEAMIESKDFQGSTAVRKEQLEAFREQIIAAEIDPDFLAEVEDKVRNDFGQRCRFRSSTNAEDVSGFNGAGLYTSVSGDPHDDSYPVEDAIREVWASVWSYRAFEERSYYSIEHLDIAMSVLVHPSFTDEEANGVAITGNIFDTSGLNPAFYVNVQLGETSVVAPPEGITSDQFLYYYYTSGQPTAYIATSNLVPEGEHVLTNDQVHELGVAMDAIHQFFGEAYNTGIGYGMDIEFKFDDLDSGGEPTLYVKQARPYPDWTD